jgi:hypothetical protein
VKKIVAQVEIEKKDFSNLLNPLNILYGSFGDVEGD